MNRKDLGITGSLATAMMVADTCSWTENALKESENENAEFKNANVCAATEDIENLEVNEKEIKRSKQKTSTVLVKGLETDALNNAHDLSTALSAAAAVVAEGPTKAAAELIPEHLKPESSVLDVVPLIKAEDTCRCMATSPDVKVKGTSSFASTISVSSCAKSDSAVSISSISQKWALSPTIYIARDYSRSMKEAFKTKYPKQLLGYISKPEWKNTIHGINELLRKGDQHSTWTVLETVLEAVTFHLYGLLVPSRKELFLDELVDFMEAENRTVYNPKRVHIRSPRLNGLRHLEIVFLDRKFDDND